MFLFDRPNIDKLRKRKDSDGLFKALSFSGRKFYEIRSGALKALGEIGDDHAVDLLCNALSNSDFNIRRNTVTALGKVCETAEIQHKAIDARVFRSLINALKDESSWVTDKVEEVLIKTGKPALGYLYEVFRSSDTGIYLKAAGIIDKIGKTGKAAKIDDKLVDIWLSIYNSEWKKIISFGSDAVEPLCTALKLYNVYTCCSITEALGIIGDKRAIEPLGDALETKDDRLLSIYALDALEKIDGIGNSASKALSYILNSRLEANIRIKAVKLLGQINCIPARPLCTALMDGYVEISNEAVKLLARISRQDAGELCEALCERIRDTHDYEKQREIVKVLVKIGSYAIEPLCHFLKDNDFCVRCRAAEALAEIYKNGDIDEADKKRIISCKSIITGIHQDIDGCIHSDLGVKYDFPD